MRRHSQAPASQSTRTRSRYPNVAAKWFSTDVHRSCCAAGERACGQVRRRLGWLRLVQRDAVRWVLTTRGIPRPGDTRRILEPDLDRRRLHDGALADGLLPAQPCRACLLGRRLGRAEERTGEGRHPAPGSPPLSMATIAWVVEDAGRCHVSPDERHAGPDRCEGQHPTAVGAEGRRCTSSRPWGRPASADRFRRCRRPDCPAGPRMPGRSPRPMPAATSSWWATPVRRRADHDGERRRHHRPRARHRPGPPVAGGRRGGRRRRGSGRRRARRRRMLRMGRSSRTNLTPTSRMPPRPGTLRRPARPARPAQTDAAHSPLVRSRCYCWRRRTRRRADAYASTVRSTNRSAKRRCASARRVGMCSVGTSCGS